MGRPTILMLCSVLLIGLIAVYIIYKKKQGS